MPETIDPGIDQIAASNRTDTAFPDNVTLTDLIERQVARDPGRIAVRFDRDRFHQGTALTYRELNERANQVARRLRTMGVGRGDIVGISVERSYAMIVGIFGILKAGAAYLPLSPDDPAERMRFVLGDAKAGIVLMHSATAARIPGDIVTVDLEVAALYAGDASNPEPAAGPDDLAYVIYTSGSTGRPKGVMIEHRSVVNRLDWMQRAYPLGRDDVLLQKTSFCFDVSVWELFWWAIEGASLSLLRPGGEKVPQALVETVRKDRVTVLHFVPSMLGVFLESLEGRTEKIRDSLGSLRRVFASGEALSPAHVQKFHAVVGRTSGCPLTNLYGPTEATVDATAYDCPDSDELELVPIGRPIQNMRAYIVRDGEPMPVGESGELCLAGVGLARGYLNNPKLTAERFTEMRGQHGERIYRTGDLARWLPDGNLQYLGREDGQVKIRGLRIELGEIENTARLLPGITDCVVISRKHSESIVVLAAYFVGSPEVTAEHLRAHLQRALPAYMVPTQYNRLQAIPLTASGKADRKALA